MVVIVLVLGADPHFFWIGASGVVFALFVTTQLASTVLTRQAGLAERCTRVTASSKEEWKEKHRREAEHEKRSLKTSFVGGWRVGPNRALCPILTEGWTSWGLFFDRVWAVALAAIEWGSE